MPSECAYAPNGCTARFVFSFLFLKLTQCNRITRGILNEHLAKCLFAQVECDGYKQYLEYLNNTEKEKEKDTSSNNSNNSQDNTNSNESIKSSSSSSSISRSSSVSASSSPLPLPEDLSAKKLLVLKNAKSCGKFLKKDLANHKEKLCPYRYSTSLSLYVILIVPFPGRWIVKEGVEQKSEYWKKR